MNEDEKKELETLRSEKRLREQSARAAAALKDAGISHTFASLLAGSDDAETDQKTAAFCEAYHAALSEDIRTRLPERAPVVTPPAPSRPKRGIQRIR